MTPFPNSTNHEPMLAVSDDLVGLTERNLSAFHADSAYKLSLPLKSAGDPKNPSLPCDERMLAVDEVVCWRVNSTQGNKGGCWAVDGSCCRSRHLQATNRPHPATG